MCAAFDCVIVIYPSVVLAIESLFHHWQSTNFLLLLSIQLFWIESVYKLPFLDYWLGQPQRHDGGPESPKYDIQNSYWYPFGTHQTADVINVFQELSYNQYLVELDTKEHAAELIENGFDADGTHTSCSPPHGYYTNVSVMGLKAYIDDSEVTSKLSTYVQVKGSVIRLKYKADHELAGLENGNRLVRVVLTQSIPYSLQIGGEWCRIIHNNQTRVCSFCDDVGHSRKNCPHAECRACGEFGHISHNCPNKEPNNEDDESTIATTH